MIIFVHLLNDRSGSPRVLCSAIEALTQNSDGSCLLVGSDGAGCLDETGVQTYRYWYKRTPYRFLTLFTYIFSQFWLFIRLCRLRSIDREAVIYVNTLLPFAAAIYGWVTQRPVVYHLHEVSVSPAPLKWFLVQVARFTARRLIYVSDFHRRCLTISKAPSRTVYNSLAPAFYQIATRSVYRHRCDGIFKILMIASLRDYKGIPEFIELALRLVVRSDIILELVLNDDDFAVGKYFDAKDPPSNIVIYSRTDNTAKHYSQASLVLNLSRPDQWVETFGLTLLEAMAYGIPVIAPPIGGPVELVGDTRGGFLIDCRDIDNLTESVLRLAEDEDLCLRMSVAARERAGQFTPALFAQALREALDLNNIRNP